MVYFQGCKLWWWLNVECSKQTEHVYAHAGLLLDAVANRMIIWRAFTKKHEHYLGRKLGSFQHKIKVYYPFIVQRERGNVHK